MRAVTWSLPAAFQGSRYTVAVFVGLLIFSSVLYSYSQRQTSGFIYWFDDWVFYADSSGSYSHMKEISFEGNMWRHPLYPIIVHPLLSAAKALLGLGTRQAARVVIALLAALNVSLSFLLFQSCLTEKGTAILLTVIYAFMFSNLVFFSVPETYSLSNIGILVFLLLISRCSGPPSNRHVLLLGLVCGTGALLNPPLGLLLVSVYALFVARFGIRPSVTPCLKATFAALLVYLGTNFMLFGFDFVEKSRKLASKWATFSNYLDPANWLNVGVSFFVYAVISPLQELERSIRLEDITGYFRSPLKILLFFAFAFYLGYAFVRLVRQQRDDLVIVAAAWLTAAFVFHVYFNPREALLYSCQVLVPFMLILGRAFEGIRWKWKVFPLGLFSIGLAIVNLRCLQA
jgi:hypothetical protein